MNWVVEDGTVVAGANTYITPDDVRSYALARGITLPVVPEGDNPIDPIAAWMVLAMDYIASFGKRFVGVKYSNGQALDWPRRAWFPYQVGLDQIFSPNLAKIEAQLVIEQNNGIQLFASTAGLAQGGGFITMRKTDVLERRFSEKIVPSNTPEMPAVSALMADLLSNGGRLVAVRG